MRTQDSIEVKRHIRAAQKGDEQAFEQLLSLLEQPVYRLAYSMLGNREDAQDATQETLIKLWRNLPQYRYECPILSYALTVARRTVLDMCRARAARPGTVPLTVETDEGALGEWDIPDESVEASPPLAYERRERIAQVRRALDALPPEQREILILKEMNSCTYEQLSHVLDIEIGTVKSRLFRARNSLGKILREWNIFE